MPRAGDQHGPLGKLGTTLAPTPGLCGLHGPDGNCATTPATCGGGNGNVGEGARRSSMTATLSAADRRRRMVRAWRRVMEIAFVDSFSLLGSGRRDLRPPIMKTAKRGQSSTGHRLMALCQRC
jgi:hypothetical protein